MPQPSLAGVEAKIARADEHLQLLEREARSFLNDDPQPIGVSRAKLDPDSGWHIAYGIMEREPPARLGVILGDVVHNVRSALDHLVWQLVLLNGGTPSRSNAFPLATTERDWKAASTGSRLKGVSAAHRAVIEKVQPYKGPNGPKRTYTGMLSHLSNVDKHQVVHATFAVILDPGAGPHRARFRVTCGPGQVVKEQVRYGNRFDRDAELMRALVADTSDETEVEVEGTIPVDIAFGERLAPIGHIKNLPHAARVIVKEFEGDFPS